MKKIVIYLQDIREVDWSIVYQFIEGCLHHRTIDNYVLSKITTFSDIAFDSDTNRDHDVVSIDSLNAFSLDGISNQNELSFVFIAQPNEESIVPLDYVPLFILQRKYYGLVSIGINLIKLPNSKAQKDLIFRFSTFYLFVDDIKPAGGFHSLYFINEIATSKSTQNQEQFYKNRVSAFRYKSRFSSFSWENVVEKQSSTKFYPLLHINEVLFLYMFQNKEEYGSIPEEVRYLKSSSEKIINQLKHVSKLSEKNFSSLFEKWFICAYFNSLSTTVDNKMFEVLYPTLHSYYIGIYELVQNIIFHTIEREGWIYVYFFKQDNLSSEIKSKLSKYNVDFSAMYLRFGIYDFSKYGIIDTYNTKQGIVFDNLANIVDPFILIPGTDKQNEYLCLTYAAHLGIKTLVSSVLSHYGLFRIETSHDGKKLFIENQGKTLCEQSITENVEGTHYDIVLPISAQNNNTQPYQVESQNAAFSFMLKERKKIQSIRMSEIVDHSYPGNIIDSEHQDQVLDKIKDKVSDLFISNPDHHFLTNYYALDMSGVKSLTANMIFKLLAAIQMGDNHVDVIVLYNLSDDIIDDMCSIVKNIGERKNLENRPIWSRDHAVILMNDLFRIQILCGETKREFITLNAWFQGRYNGFKNVFSEWNYIENEIDPEVDNKFLLPYECMIYDDNEKPIFFNSVSNFLDKTENINNNYGFLADGIFTKIGSKMYVEKFYDANTIFLNGFFVDRLAFFFAKDIIRKTGSELSKIKNIVLVGYRLFSDLTIRKIQSYINTFAERDIVQDIIIAEDGDKSEESVLSFRPVIDKDDKMQRRRFHDSLFVLIVPVASTLSTHDKIVTYIKKEAGINTEPLFLNYCAILVRDGQPLSISPFEKKWRWSSSSYDSIITGLIGAGYVSYLVSKSSKWHNLIDDKTFPSSYTEESYLNRTGDASLNLWDMFGYPTVSLPSMDLIKDEVLHFGRETNADDSRILELFFKITQRRIKELSPYIYVGHLNFGHNHHRYFFDTESYLRHGNYEELTKWMCYVKENNRLWQDHSKVPVIIVPDYNKESTFIHLVNMELFDNNALIICINVSDSIENVRANYSFLSENAGLFSFYFIDHAILTSETYEKTRICLSAIMDKPDFKFNGIMVIVNRLSEMKYINILENLEGGIINSFIHFFIPPSKERGEDCTLCGLKKHYGNLLSFSVVEACRRAIKSNIAKFNLETDLIKNHIVGKSGRKFKRMELRNNLFLMITCIQKNYPIDFIINNNRKKASTNEITNEKSIVIRLENALSCYYQNLSNDIDSKISFLKAITFPPLSQYVYIRRFAHRLTIKELQRVLSKPDPKYEDFCLLKTLLKHLSWLSSNAIIRKEVIISSWRLCFTVANDILNEIRESNEKRINKDSNSLLNQWIMELRKQLLKIEDFGTYYQFCIKNATYIDETKSFYLGELLRTGNEVDIRCPIRASETTLYNSLFMEIKSNEIPEFSLVHNEYIVHNPFNIFLSNIYYDNTTIFRKTLDNFSHEIKKDEELSQLFYVDLKSYKPYDFEEFNNKVNRICEKMLDIVNTQYYYSWFRFLLVKDIFNPDRCLDATRDGVPLIRKLVYVLYAKMTIDNIIKKEGLNIEKDATLLLKIFSAIMDARHSFISINYNGELYTLANNKASIKFVNSKNNLFCGRYLTMDEGRILYPFIITESSISTDEKRVDEIKTSRVCCQLLGMDNSKGCHSYFGAVTYLYDDNEISFQIKKLECSRILLLLKLEIDKYVNECNKDKLFELWLKNMNTINRFKRINLSSNHSLSLDGWDFEKLDFENYKKMDNGFYMLSNLVISHLFSMLTTEHGISIKSVTKNIDEIFSNKFLSLLEEISINRWGGKLKIIKKNDDDDGHRFTENALIIQSFVIQCINNAYEKLTKKNDNEHFVIKLIIGTSSVEIRNNFPGIEMTKILKEKKKFDNLYKVNIIKQNLALDRMSDYGMTLSSLLIYGNTDVMKCECGFDLSGDPSFRVRLSSRI